MNFDLTEDQYSIWIDDVVAYGLEQVSYFNTNDSDIKALLEKGFIEVDDEGGVVRLSKTVKDKIFNLLELWVEKHQGMSGVMEKIRCTECGWVQYALAEDTAPYVTKIHNCDKCDWLIMESGWEKVDDEPGEALADSLENLLA